MRREEILNGNHWLFSSAAPIFSQWESLQTWEFNEKNHRKHGKKQRANKRTISWYSMGITGFFRLFHQFPRWFIILKQFHFHLLITAPTMKEIYTSHWYNKDIWLCEVNIRWTRQYFRRRKPVVWKNLISSRAVFGSVFRADRPLSFFWEVCICASRLICPARRTHPELSS